MTFYKNKKKYIYKFFVVNLWSVDGGRGKGKMRKGHPVSPLRMANFQDYPTTLFLPKNFPVPYSILDISPYLIPY